MYRYHPLILQGDLLGIDITRLIRAGVLRPGADGFDPTLRSPSKQASKVLQRPADYPVTLQAQDLLGRCVKQGNVHIGVCDHNPIGYSFQYGPRPAGFYLLLAEHVPKILGLVTDQTVQLGVVYRDRHLGCPCSCRKPCPQSCSGRWWPPRRSPSGAATALAGPAPGSRTALRSASSSSACGAESPWAPWLP